MSATFQLVLDTTGPQGVIAKLNADDAATATQDVTLTATSTDTDVAQALIWGDVDLAANPDIQDTEAGSTPISYAASFAVRLSAGDGVKTVYVKLIDDVGNASAQASDAIQLISTAPTVNVTAGPTPGKISKVAGFDTSAFTFSADQDIVAWKVTVVPDQTANESSGTTIPSAAGSTNMTGAALAASTAVNATIKGTDLESASPGDATKQIKVFVQNEAGTWSV